MCILKPISVVSCTQVNALDGLGQTALHRVSQQGNMQACRLLLQYGVDPSIVSLQGYTAAQLATDSVQKMLRGKSPTVCCTHWLPSNARKEQCTKTFKMFVR